MKLYDLTGDGDKLERRSRAGITNRCQHKVITLMNLKCLRGVLSSEELKGCVSLHWESDGLTIVALA